jgi:hypothetical protein
MMWGITLPLVQINPYFTLVTGFAYNPCYMLPYKFHVPVLVNYLLQNRVDRQ